MTLPDEPSELITLALADLAKVEAAPGEYRVAMGVWHSPDPGTDLCAVCLAGAVIAMTLRGARGMCLWPEDFSKDTRRKLGALDSLREGRVYNALRHLGYPECVTERAPISMPVGNYASDPARFRRNMERMAAILREQGL